MKPTEIEIRAEAERRYNWEQLHEQNGFEEGAEWALSKDSTIEKVKELRDEYYNRNLSLGLKTFNEFIFKLNAIIEAK